MKYSVPERLRLVQASTELYDSICVIEEKYELTLFELLMLLSDQANSFARNGIELEMEELREKSVQATPSKKSKATQTNRSPKARKTKTC